MKKLLVVIVGPTAVGKTAVSVQLAKRLSCAVINADSRQVYREMTIGTAKPTIAEMEDVKHYFVDDRSVREDWSAGLFEREALEVIEHEFSTKDICLVSGGSGLYIDALCYGLNDFPQVKEAVRRELMTRLNNEGAEALYAELMQVDLDYAQQTEPQNSQRIVRALEIYLSSGKKYSELRTGMQAVRNFEIQYIGLERDRKELYERINRRMDQMIEEGLFAEAEALYDLKDKNALQTVGYNEVFLYLDGEIDKPEAIRILKRNSRRYAKRQMTWFKRQSETAWFHPTEIDRMEALIRNRLHA
jgi:tRNA dimethylallyltransferase